MPINATMAIIANANAIAAEQRALEAKKIACKDVETHFTGTEGIEAKQQYAECIGVLYPKPADEREILGEKILIAALFIGIIVGFVHAAIDRYSDGEKWIVLPAIWGIVFPFALSIAFGLFYLLTVLVS